MSSNYTLTVKFAPKGTPHFNRENNQWEISNYGHVWLEARQPRERLDEKPSFSGGWSPGNNWLSVKDNFSQTDWQDYQGKNISSITVEISKSQFEQLKKYPDLAKAGKIPGFRSVYDAGDNSCIDFAGKGLGYIGLASKEFDGSGLFWARPDKQVNAFLEQIAKHRAQGASLTVEHIHKSYQFSDNERDVKRFWRNIDPYWKWAQDQQESNPYGQQNQVQYAQARPLTLADMPKQVQDMCGQCRTLLTEFDKEEGVTRSSSDYDAISLSMATKAYAAGLPEVKFIHVQGDGQINMGYESPQGMFKDTSIHTNQALALSLEDNVSQSKQTERDFALAEEQRAREAEYRAHSYGGRSYG
ncbi:hypothetical protein [Neisseria sp.]|uniref:hypothetical protein n=1 Tax=Neisseria sp. TaxID=192066 RepID=UPI0035A0823E